MRAIYIYMYFFTIVRLSDLLHIRWICSYIYGCKRCGIEILLPYRPQNFFEELSQTKVDRLRILNTFLVDIDYWHIKDWFFNTLFKPRTIWVWSRLRFTRIIFGYSMVPEINLIYLFVVLFSSFQISSSTNAC